jgi:hypothetical protein
VTAVLHGRWRLSGPPEPPCGRRLQTTREGRRLKTVVLSVAGKGATRSRQVRTGKMCDERQFSAVDVSKANQVASEPRSGLCLGMNLGDIRLLPRWCPAYRQHEPGPGSRVERVKACPILPAGEKPAARGRAPSGRIREEQSTDAWRAGGPACSSCEAPAYRSGGGAKGRGRPGEWMRSTGREEPHA